MHSLQTKSFLLLLLASTLLLFSSCKKEKERIVSFPGYIKKENTYHRLDSALVFYDSLSADKTVFSLQLFSEDATTNLVVFDYLLLQNTHALLPGAYPYQKLHTMQDLQTGRFHEILLKCNWPLMSGLSYPVTGGNLVIDKQCTTYTINGSFVMDRSQYTVHFEGPVQHIKSW